ncbi:zinc finger CCCH domain-containing protein 39-like [Salvia hispanica]|uniref:zinc finger CCCH domain-containing protein 39-like n=1 Tax=Salvia hispanica TaxID=49212 RepID=UPI00200956F6|nr:zinc finger CCCH domain-containing protein 39-like [Salvia hispanica]
MLSQDLTNRHRMVLTRLRSAAKQAQTLRQENVNLKMANLDLNNRLNLPQPAAAFSGVAADPLPGIWKKGVRGAKGGNPKGKNRGMFKTCNKWQQTGACPYGANCQFAHGIAELRPVLRHPRYKTEVCRMVLNGVPCPYGHRCHFRHTLTEEEELVRAMNTSTLQPMNYR